MDGFYTPEDYWNGVIHGEKAINLAHSERKFVALSDVEKRLTVWTESFKVGNNFLYLYISLMLSKT